MAIDDLSNLRKALWSEKNVKTYEQPDPFVSEKDKDESWYKANLRYYSTFYNKNENIIKEEKETTEKSPIEKGLDYYRYFIGKQRNIDYNYATTDLSGNTLQSVWIKGKKVRQMIAHLLGNLLNQLENKDISVKSLSKDIAVKKTEMLNNLMLAYDTDLAKVFNLMAQMGVRYTPAGDRRFESVEDAERWVEYDWKDNTELYAQYLGEALEERNDTTTMLLQCFIDFACADYCAVYSYNENNKTKQIRIPFYNLIWDKSKDDPFNRDMRFGGFFEKLTPSEIFAKYSLNETQKATIKEMADNKTATKNKFNTGNTDWWDFNSDLPLVSCLTMFWSGPRDIKYKKKIDKWGNVSYKRTKEDTGEYIIQDLHKAILVGNEVLVESSYAKNVVRRANKRATPEIPIKVLCGDGCSLVEVISEHQDRIDFYRYKITEMIGKSAGKTYIIHSEKLPQGMKATELLNDLKTTGIHVTTTSGESEDPANAQRLVETVDLTFDPNIQMLAELRMQEEKMMEETINIPKIALGQQTSYIGLGTQRGTIAQSTLGLITMYRNFAKFNEINLQYGINLNTLIINEKNEDAKFIIGERGIKYFELTKEIMKNFRFQDFLVFIKVKDIIDEKDKQEMIMIAQAMAQNQEIDMLDYIKIKKATNYTKLEKELIYSIKARRREIAQAQMRKEAMQREEQDKELQAKAELKGIELASGDYRKEIETQGKMFGAMVNADKEKSPRPEIKKT